MADEFPEGGESAPQLIDGAPEWAAGLDEDTQRQIIAAHYQTPADLAKGYVSARREMSEAQQARTEMEEALLEALQDDGQEYYQQEEEQQPYEGEDFSAFADFDWREFVNRYADQQGDIEVSDIAAVTDHRSRERDLQMFQAFQNETNALRAQIAQLQSALGPMRGDYATQSEQRVEAAMRETYGDDFDNISPGVASDLALLKSQNPGWIPTQADLEDIYHRHAGVFYADQQRQRRRAAAASSQGPGASGSGPAGRAGGPTERDQMWHDLEQFARPSRL